MSPEINGNPPSVAKRKKNRDKKVPVINMNSFDLNMPNNTYFPSNMPTYHNSSIQDISAYYSFINCTNPSEPMSLPIYPMNYNANYSYPSNPNNNFMGNISTPKHATLPNNIFQMNGDNTEYLSLPVANTDQNDEHSKRRFSDPGLPNESDSSTTSIDERIIQKLSYQVNSLQESNRKLSREVMELRIEMNILKQQQNVGHYSRDYEPGMLSDVIREVRDAARVREDALLAKVKHMIEERQLSMNHMHLVGEKNRNNDRISKLEDQLKNLSVNQSSRSLEETSKQISQDTSASSSARQVLELESEVLELRRELQDTRAKKEKADQKCLQLDKKYANILRRNDITTSDMSEDGKTSAENVSSASLMSQAAYHPPRVITLSGPVTDL